MVFQGALTAKNSPKEIMFHSKCDKNKRWGGLYYGVHKMNILCDYCDIYN